VKAPRTLLQCSHLSSKRGSAAVEAAVAFGALALILSGGLVAAYMSFARVLIDRNTYEALVCASSTATRQSCEQKFRASVAHALPVGEIKSFHLVKLSRIARAEVRFAISQYEFIHHSDSREIPYAQK
jgi:hypothetical protein